MNPEDRALLERSLKLSEENNQILRKMQRAARRAAIYGFLKLLIIVVPLVIGYFYLEPYIEQIWAVFQNAKEVISKPELMTR